MELITGFEVVKWKAQRYITFLYEESFLEQAMQQIIAPIDAAHKPLGNSSARECLSMLRRICKYAAHLRLIRPMNA